MIEQQSAAFSRVSRVLAAIACGVLLCFVMAPTCGGSVPAADPPPPMGPASGDDVETIEDFIGCLNANLLEEYHTIADTVQCLPEKCSLTLTMSENSAQAACSVGGCQLPRVILDCPGPPRFFPSYLLCPLDSESGGHLGVNRVELGQVIDDMGNMRMADVPVEPGPFTPLYPHDVLSVVGASKGCNGCHTAVGAPAAGQEEISAPIDAHDRPGCIISTDACGKAASPGTCGSKTVTAQSLSEVCECIHEGLVTAGSGLDNAQGQIVADLCDNLLYYQQTRGVCGSEECPPASGPECSDVGASCSQITGATVAQSTGYSCQFQGDEAGFQCVSDCACRDYQLLGGGKFLLNGAVSMVRLEVSGNAAGEHVNPLVDSSDIFDSISAFNYLTHTLVESESLSFFEVSVSGADFAATGTGVALVNGVTTNIEFDVSRSGSDVFFEVRDADTSMVLAGGMGETGRAAFELTVAP